MIDNEPKFLEIQALVCKECHLCFDVYTNGIPLDCYKECECGCSAFIVEDGKVDARS